MTTATVAHGRVSTLSRITALGRAELTLLLRSKASLFTVLFLPVIFTFAMRQPADELDLAGTGLTVGTVLVPASIGFVLIFAVYSNLVGVYVARREELVLKRLRTGEANDAELLSANALPSMIVALVQSVLLLVGGAAVLDLEAPQRFDLVVVGVLLGLVMMSALAALSSRFAGTTESAQLIPLPMMMVSMLGSGVFVPLEVLPDRLAEICRFLPLSPVMELVRGGWAGTLEGGDIAAALVIGLAWAVGSVLAVRRWFRWEPRS
ncbi:ABC transporter permease [Streptomyces sp. P38-E01]|uniref:Transport permease protein n=1 Tax=Streptomyces tardus TaxID=2780544 RepID=A0A949JCG6_9ACTN|nr:ABC transporter permease [Streptomyces tardus]MBU7597482.1 ABC transporter permease [Streptomyces tardus]